MDERIKDLAYQAVQLVADERTKGDLSRLNTDSYQVKDLIQQKFAELIVQECYETIKKDMELAHIQLIPIDFGIYANGRLRRIIKEHFGLDTGTD